jgi:hypothetical protein
MFDHLKELLGSETEQEEESKEELLERCKRNVKISLSNIRLTEEMIEKSKRGQTAWEPEDWYAYLEEVKDDLEYWQAGLEME